MTKTDALKQELVKLQNEMAAFQTQCTLFEEFISMARSPDKPEFIKGMLRKTIEITIELTGAEHGSLVLLDGDGVVVDSILTRGEVSPEISSMLIGTVFRKGLAGWVVREREIGLVDDTHNDERWLTLPNEPYEVRAALALPIISGEMMLGILTLMHSTPGHFKKEMAELMKITGNQVALVLENAYLFTNLNKSFKSLGKAKKKIEAYSKALDLEMEKGHQIQQDFLPRQLLRLPNWHIEAVLHTARRVSGDFYDVFKLPGGYIGLVIGDVCDKGVGSALFMALFRSLIRIFSGQPQLSESRIDTRSKTVGGKSGAAPTKGFDQADPLSAIAMTNDYIAQEHHEMSMFATLFFGVLNPKNGKLAYINAGHEAVFVIDPSGAKESLVATGSAVGMFPHLEFEYKQTQLAPGDILFAYTDGVTEALSPDQELFTKERLSSLLSKPPATAGDLLEMIKNNLFDHIGNASLEDDITMLALQRNKK
jgi:sigma-B regulation protein RsbU (phosphoserine phosphatase)